VYALALLRDGSETPGGADLEGLAEFRMADTALVFRAGARPVPPALRVPPEVVALLRGYGTVRRGPMVPLQRN
jgi:hypothetical protein